MDVVQHRAAQSETGNVMQDCQRNRDVERRPRGLCVGRARQRRAPPWLRDVCYVKFGGDALQARGARVRDLNHRRRCVHADVAHAPPLAFQPFRQPTVPAADVQYLYIIANVRYNSVEPTLRAGARFRERVREFGIEFSVDGEQAIDELSIHA